MLSLRKSLLISQLSTIIDSSMKYFESYGCCTLIRLYSSDSLSKPGNKDTALAEKYDINPEFVNRNPKNLEKMAIALKSIGWELESPSRAFYHRLHFEITNKNTTAWLEHSSGKVVVIASTKEWAIRKHLYRNVDVSAVENISHILTQRCLEAGISCVNICFPPEKMQTEKLSAFIKTVTDGGLTLEEPETFEPLPHWQIEKPKNL